MIKQTMHDPLAAARILDRHLGQGVDYWIQYLRDDRQSTVASRNDSAEVNWIFDDTDIWYDERELYAFIAKRHPKALGIGSTTSYGSAPSNFFVSVAVDYVRAAQLVVEVSAEGEVFQLSSTQARLLAQALTDGAKYCDSHVYKVIEKKVQVRKHGAKGTGDAELDKLLRDLGPRVDSKRQRSRKRRR